MAWIETKTFHSYNRISDRILGWLTPTRFYIVNWGKHEKWATDEVFRNDWLKEQEEFEEDYYSLLSKDFLIYQKNYILLDDPGEIGDLYITMKPQLKLTKFQEQFLMDYLIENNDIELYKELFNKVH